MDEELHKEQSDAENEDTDDYEAEVDEEPIQQRFGRERRITVSAEVYNAMQESENWQPPCTPKHTELETWLRRVLEVHCLFKHLDDREMRTVTQALFPCTYRCGQNLCMQGMHFSKGRLSPSFPFDFFV